MNRVSLILFMILSFAGCEDSAKINLCGNGELNDGEDCDGDRFRINPYCSHRGYSSGMVLCTSDCKYDYSECEGYSSCGDGKITEDEDCDGNLLKDADCMAIGYHYGELSCNEYCKYDISDCERCGDGVIQKDEVCDVFGPYEVSCADEALFGGPAICSDDCTGPDYSKCNGLFVIGSGRYDGIDSATIDNDGNLLLFGYTGGHLFGETNADPDCVSQPFFHGGYEEYKFPYQYFYSTCFDSTIVKIDTEGRLINVLQSGSINSNEDFIYLGKNIDGNYVVLSRKNGHVNYDFSFEPYEPNIHWENSYIDIINENLESVHSVSVEMYTDANYIGARLLTGQDTVILAGRDYNGLRFAMEIDLLTGSTIWSWSDDYLWNGRFTSATVLDSNTVILSAVFENTRENLYRIDRTTGEMSEFFMAPLPSEPVTENYTGVSPVTISGNTIQFLSLVDNEVNMIELDTTGALLNQSVYRLFGKASATGYRFRGFKSSSDELGGNYEGKFCETSFCNSFFYLEKVDAGGAVERFYWGLDNLMQFKGIEISGDTIFIYGEFSASNYRKGFVFKKEFSVGTLSGKTVVK
ncbi:hypothetical protein KKF34_15285 [Myxococcota bacterium]|nr:hypothetical protein [Myxococcota bacterium]MBU1383067.1 hypothetical protein [Myxococcota bacterium]MBU1498240.1 hypothetical protein [Myxococcota bacterium]